MPPKSTWFEPKLLSGIWLCDLDEWDENELKYNDFTRLYDSKWYNQSVWKMDHFRCERCGSWWAHGFESITTTAHYAKPIHVLDKGECNQSNHDCLRSVPAIVNCDLIIGVGGGRALDVPKWGADSMQKPYFVFQLSLRPVQLVHCIGSLWWKPSVCSHLWTLKMRIDISS